ncbi:hypothetical protein RHODGE_RHODGE_02992 [Rhodoplanes serenus]|uniref:DSBA-like thioredoxin domain-containing protein n=1 Tax=Rhodoplanes serenus TaxID=200615 RepID=A0A3S4FDW0_9BRAD|nr:DsbA family oxidoreductase [Rhodoplanes serenus]VCU09821.1 hypothetical protein RHODGE_RHODGE_02992 [Rhodoplanes serenus]
MSDPTALPAMPVDVVSDVVCPWCYIGKRRLERALATTPDLPSVVRWRAYFLNPWVPRAGISRTEYLTTKFGSVDRYMANVPRIAAAAADEGLRYDAEAIARQPNTIDCHRLIRWADAAAGPDGAARMKQRLMDLYFAEGADLTRRDVLAEAAASVGLDRDAVAARLATDADEAAVTEEAEAAQRAGVQGVPCFVLGGVLAISGAQSPDYLAEALSRAHVAFRDKLATGEIADPTARPY